MKLTVNIVRILVGILFIFSGLIKAFDPLGLAYKMQEFFDVWAGAGIMPSIMNRLHEYALLFAMILNALEILTGVALLVGWRKKMTTWVLLVLSILFTLLTAYALFTGKVNECGCFGTCIPLTPMQTFVKDIVLLVLVLIIFFGRKYIQPLFKDLLPSAIMLATIILIALLQSSALRHLPWIDCLPYKKGNNLLELRKTPPDATYDKVEYIAKIYTDGKTTKEFPIDAAVDTAIWKFVDYKTKLLEKGNGKKALISDFSLTDSLGNDSTETILGQSGQYYLFFIKNLNDGTSHWEGGFAQLWKKAKEQNREVYIVTPQRDKVNDFLNVHNHYNAAIYGCDETQVKTAARCNPTVFLMKGPVVQGKWSWADIDDAIKN